MDKDKLNKDMNKMFQNKRFVNCLIVLLVIIFLWLAVSNFLGNDSNVSDKNNAPKGAQEVSTNDGGMTSKELLSYEEDQKKQLEDILSKMSGVGQVVVTIHFESRNASASNKFKYSNIRNSRGGYKWRYKAYKARNRRYNCSYEK